MKLGAQLFSVREHLKTPEDILETFRRIREIGYENVQFSGAPLVPEVIVRASEQYGLPVVCTHAAPQRILEETDAVIAEHKAIGCDVVGLGLPPKHYRDKTMAGFHRFLNDFDGPTKKILDAGLRFAYHNHAAEFTPVEDSELLPYDLLLETHPDWDFILDTYWVVKAGQDVPTYLKKAGGSRLKNVHFKDMAPDEEKSMCACGDGVLDFASIAVLCKELGTENILVEQDNAETLGDGFAELEKSFRHLRPIID